MKDEYSFSVQLKSRDHVKQLSLGQGEEVFFEGYLGELQTLGLIEDTIIEVKGINGILRIDMNRSQIQSLLHQEGEA